MIENPKIDTWRKGGKDRVGKAEETKIENGAKLRLTKTFNSLPFELRSYAGKTVKGFKSELDKWLGEEVPDQPRLNGMITAAKDNTIKFQHEMWKTLRSFGLSPSNYKKWFLTLFWCSLLKSSVMKSSLIQSRKQKKIHA